MPGWEDEYADYDDEELDQVRNAWARAGHTPHAAAGWGLERDPRDVWGYEDDPRIGWGEGAQDPRAAWGGATLMRTHSQGQPKSPGKKKQKKRANSFSGGQLQGAWGMATTFSEHNLSRRPEDWREGYSPRGISGADLSFSSFFRVSKKPDPNEWSGDNKKRTLAGVLTFNANRPSISYDMRRPPDETPFMGQFKPRSVHEMVQPAVTPPTGRMRLMHPRLPWYIDVLGGYHAPGVTLSDVLRSLFVELDRPIGSQDFWNEELGKREREGLTRAFKERCAQKGDYMREEMLLGVKRVDFLGPECIFVGLVRRNGMWEIKTDSNL
ncbi:hypothetical protein DFH06DRAFT_1240393 [Mycena polygramma]|nr:hypothetical protein DFH06DRAFT_1240393 [Mycena polygramma]